MPSPQPDHDDLTRLAARLFRTPLALLVLKDDNGRLVTAGSYGFPPDPGDESATGVAHSIRLLLMADGMPLIVRDEASNTATDTALLEGRAPPVLNVVAQLGVPVPDASGTPLGALWIGDSGRRDWSDDDVQNLGELAARAGREIELRRESVERERLVEALRQRSRPERLFELAPVLVCAVNGPDHVFVFANERYIDAFGGRDLIGRPVRDVLPELESQGVVALLDEVLASGRAHVGTDVRVMIARSPGAPPDEHCVNFVLQPITDDGGAASGVFVLGVDVTEQFRARQLLERHDALLRETQRIARIGSWDYDVERRAVAWTEEMYSLHAVAPGAAPPSPDGYMALVHPDDRAAVREAVERAIATGVSFAVDYRIVRPDGDVRSLHGRGHVEVDADGRAVRLLGSCQDITDRLETLAALRVSEERYRLVRRATNDVIWDLDLAAGMVTVDESAFVALRHPRPEPSDAIRWWERHIHPDDAERVLGSLRDVLESGGDVWEAEYRFLRGDGSYAELADHAHVLRDPAGRAVRLVGAAQDVTERHALESRLRDAQRMEAVGRLAGGIAHDFNNLLTVISANTMFVRGEVAPDGQAAADLDQIDEASRRAADLTRQLLAFGRRQILHPRQVDVNAMVAGVAEAVRRTNGAGVQIETRLAPRPWPAHADPMQLEQVLLDLVANARHAMPAGGTIRITTANLEVDGTAAREHPDLPAGSYVSLTVEDSGTGIPPDLLPHIFEPFATTREAGRGAGLGLATVHGIVTQSGGHVEARSTPGAGTTITVLLPRGDGTVPSTVQPPARTSEGGRETVLLVEDEPAVRASLGRVLKRRGYNVVEATNGEEALRIWHDRQEYGPGTPGSAEVAATGRIDLVLTDLVMPVLGGRLLVERLRAAQPDVRVVLMSGYTADSTEVPAVLTGTGRSAFLQKPIRPDELLRTVRHVIEDHPPPETDDGGRERQEATSGRNSAAGGEET